MIKPKIIVVLVFLAAVAAVLSAQIVPIRLCCIAGNYSGSHIHNPLPNCPLPQSEAITMTISQSRGCGADVWGTITGPSGDVNAFKGTLSRGLRGCCVLNASFSSPGHPEHVVTLKGSFCMKMGKWTAKGTYTEINSSDPCKQSGSWQIKQI
jgi:hypothetical protein